MILQNPVSGKFYGVCSGWSWKLSWVSLTTDNCEACLDEFYAVRCFSVGLFSKTGSPEFGIIWVWFFYSCKYCMCFCLSCAVSPGQSSMLSFCSASCSLIAVARSLTSRSVF